MITVNGVEYNATNRISTRDQFNLVLASLLAVCDLSQVGQVKEHFEKVEGEKTENVTGMFITSQIRLPGITAATYDGTTWYTKHAALKLDLFHISESEFATTQSNGKPKAATIDAGTMKERLAAIAAKQAAKPAQVATTV